ncbi:hypothetical protein CAC42_3918 [Sphaceloma murrayae]|uniref:Spherulation-specific family 4 n=1 Tax=Sphaceloma murrayae TaxID=2082308 RepID=A0A2K1QSK0_9PEZI|nr:hypothetical protein CAC42_3918 [Sphaceloma murrayae]
MVAFRPYILFPLYLYPSPNAWKPLYDQIDQYPKVNFEIIVNPNSGPGTGVPDQNWIDTLSKLNSKPNTNLIGYVSTQWATRDMAAVKQDISAYASWTTYKKANLTIEGIFFDEAPADASPALVSYMRNVTAFARSALKTPTKRIVFNPGCPVPKDYYAIADTIVGFEDYYKQYKNDVASFPINTVKPGTKFKTAFIIQGFSGTAQQQKQIVTRMAENNITGVYISTQSAYDKFSRFWPQLVAQINGIK